MSRYNYSCPKCGSFGTYWSAYRESWVCGDCDALFDRDGEKKGDISRNDPDAVVEAKKASTGTRGSRRRRRVGDIVGGYTVIQIEGARILWERKSSRGASYIVDNGSKRVHSGSVKEEAEKFMAPDGLS